MLKIATTIALLYSGIYAKDITINELFNSLKQQPISKKDLTDIKKANLDKQSAKNALYPKLYGELSYEHYNRPASLRPVLPTETSTLLANDEPLPFSNDITKVGVNLSFPIFIKSLYTIKNKASLLKIASKDKQKLNLIQREATILGANANLKYLENLIIALNSKKSSISKTREDILIKVENGRVAQIALIKIDKSINDIDISINNINTKIDELKSTIFTLSGIDIQKSVPLTKISNIQKDTILALLPLKASLKAKQLGVKASKESLYPALSLKANYSRSYADGYNNDKSLSTDFGSIGLYLKIPLFDNSKFTQIQKAKISYMNEKLNIEDVKHSLLVKASKLEKNLILLKRSKSLAEKSIVITKELLKVAKISYTNGRMDEEEYLRYENSLFDAFASLYEVDAKRWEDIAQLAVIYGNNLKRIVK
jgi:outer membrane protein TolC